MAQNLIEQTIKSDAQLFVELDVSWILSQLKSNQNLLFEFFGYNLIVNTTEKNYGIEIPVEGDIFFFNGKIHNDTKSTVSLTVTSNPYRLMGQIEFTGTNDTLHRISITHISKLIGPKLNKNSPIHIFRHLNELNYEVNKKGEIFEVSLNQTIHGLTQNGTLNQTIHGLTQNGTLNQTTPGLTQNGQLYKIGNVNSVSTSQSLSLNYYAKVRLYADYYYYLDYGYDATEFMNAVNSVIDFWNDCNEQNLCVEIEVIAVDIFLHEAECQDCYDADNMAALRDAFGHYIEDANAVDVSKKWIDEMDFAFLFVGEGTNATDLLGVSNVGSAGIFNPEPLREKVAVGRHTSGLILAEMNPWIISHEWGHLLDGGHQIGASSPAIIPRTANEWLEFPLIRQSNMWDSYHYAGAYIGKFSREGYNGASADQNNAYEMRKYISENFRTFESFEYDGWDSDWIAPSDNYWDRSLNHWHGDGSYALQGDGGTWSQSPYSYWLQDTDFYDGSIEGWHYSKNTNGILKGLVLRADANNCRIQQNIICNGYMFRTTHNPTATWQLLRFDFGSFSVLDSGSLTGGWWINKWHHLKFEAIGNQLTGWASLVDMAEPYSDDLGIKLFTYDIPESDVNRYYYGKAGFGSRIAPNSYPGYWDEIKIQPNRAVSHRDTFFRTFPDGLAENGWLIPEDPSGLWSRGSVPDDPAKNGSNSLKAYKGDWSQYGYWLYNFNDYFTFSAGSVEGWHYSTNTNGILKGLVLRADTNACGNPKAIICNGYMFRTTHNPTATWQLLRFDNGSYSVLDSGSLTGGWWINQWHHLKFEAIGNQLTGWASLSEDGDLGSKLFTYDIPETDPYRYYYGKAGFGSRIATNSYPGYWDLVTITSYGPNQKSVF